jgi:hypothetical protein
VAAVSSWRACDGPTLGPTPTVATPPPTPQRSELAAQLSFRNQAPVAQWSTGPSGGPKSVGLSSRRSPVRIWSGAFLAVPGGAGNVRCRAKASASGRRCVPEASSRFRWVPGGPCHIRVSFQPRRGRAIRASPRASPADRSRPRGRRRCPARLPRSDSRGRPRCGRGSAARYLRDPRRPVASRRSSLARLLSPLQVLAGVATSCAREARFQTGQRRNRELVHVLIRCYPGGHSDKAAPGGASTPTEGLTKRRASSSWLIRTLRPARVSCRSNCR